MKNYDYLVPYAVVRCSDYLTISCSLALSLQTHGKNEMLVWDLGMYCSVPRLPGHSHSCYSESNNFKG